MLLIGVKQAMILRFDSNNHSTLDIALRTVFEAASCAVHSKCRHALECADKCVPGKYAAALAAMPRETII